MEVQISLVQSKIDLYFVSHIPYRGGSVQFILLPLNQKFLQTPIYPNISRCLMEQKGLNFVIVF